MIKIILKNNLFPGILLALAFFLVGLLTISDYGLNVDEPNHFMRGQALLHYLRTGEKTFKNLDVDHPSAWQWKGQDGEYYLYRKEASHPTLSDIWAAFFNYILYQKLGVIGDLEAYHLYEISASSMLIFLIYFMLNMHYGRFSGVVGALSLFLYPLFLGESHFNIKDPVEAVFFSFTVFLFYLGVKKKSGFFFVLSSVSFAAALGTKFNAAFIPFILVPYLVIRFRSVITKHKFYVLKQIPAKIYASFIVAGIFSVAIYFYFNPQLWSNPLGKFINEQGAYYLDIGTGTSDQPDYDFYGWHFYPMFFVTISTPLVILLYTLLGIYFAIKKENKEKDKFSLFLLFWFFVPLLRVTFPGTSIYSGVRQIMEYVPALAAISGLGAYCLVAWLHIYTAKLLHVSNRTAIKLLQLFVILSFLPIALKLISMHPNENMYINPLVGGVKGAVDKKIPGAAESMGNAYLQGMWWLNKHAEKNAHFKPAVGMASNIPRQFMRSDLELDNAFSGMKRDGEYMMSMLSVDFPPPRYSIQYLSRFLDPVYIVQVDGATILKIWKNDREHTKKGYLNEKVEQGITVSGGKSDGYIDVKLLKQAFITRIEMSHGTENCVEKGEGGLLYSSDGKNIFSTPDELYNGQGVYGASLQTKNRYVYFFPAFKANWIRILPSDPNLCLLQAKDVTVYSLKDIVPK